MSRAFLYSLIAFLLLLLLLSYSEIVDLYKYSTVGECEPHCVLLYRVEGVFTGGEGLKKLHYFRRVELKSNTSMLFVEIEDRGRLAFSLKTKLKECSNVGYRLAQTSPSLASCNIASRGGRSFSSFLVLEKSFNGYNAVLVYGSQIIRKNSGLIQVIVKLENTSCSYRCFALNTGYYAFALLLKTLVSAGIATSAYIASRVWRRH